MTRLINEPIPEDLRLLHRHAFVAQSDGYGTLPVVISQVFEVIERIILLQAALESIATYGSDTLSGRADGGPDDRDWQRQAVKEMRDRARAALAKVPR